MVCPNCGSQNVTVQAVAEQNKRGCFTVFIMIILLFIPIIGWITLFMLLRGRKTETVSYAVCQTCGNRWTLTAPQNNTDQNQQPTMDSQQPYPQQPQQIGYQQPYPQQSGYQQPYQQPYQYPYPDAAQQQANWNNGQDNGSGGV